MSKNTTVVISSHKRPDRVKARYLVPHAIICVAESQEAEYKKNNPENEIVTHPDTVVGLSAKRNWVYGHFGTHFSLDDDVTVCSPRYEDPKITTHSLDPVRTQDVIENLMFITQEMGAYLCGFGNLVQPVFYDPFKPIYLTGVAMGHNFGIVKGSSISWDETMKVGTDFYASGLNAYYHRKCVIDNRFYFQQKETMKASGGLSEFRTLEVEKQATLKLIKLFGKAMSIKQNSRRLKLIHPYQRALKVPF